MATSTPWGPSQGSQKLAPGIIQYSTAGHGGIHVCPTLNAQVHRCWRKEDGWYEEDCEWAIVAFTFPAAFKPEDYKHAVVTVKNWMPDEYMRVTGTVLTASDSYKLQKRAFIQANRHNMVAVSALGKPGGMVEVTACRGGRLENGRYASTEMRHFLVPTAEYTIPFVVDETRHREIVAV